MSKFSKEDLDECRVRIDAIDLRLIELLNERRKLWSESAPLKDL